MKFLVRTDQAARALPGSPPSYDIPNGTITWVTLIYLFVNIIATSASNFISNKPQRDIDAKNATLKNQNFKVQLLQRCLEGDSADRRSSLEMILYTDVFTKEEKTELMQFVNRGHIPKWPVRNIEPLSSYLSATGSAYYGLNLNQPNPALQQAQQPPVPAVPPIGGGSQPR